MGDDSKKIEQRSAIINSAEINEIGMAIMAVLNEQFIDRSHVSVQAALVQCALSVGIHDKQVDPGDTIRMMVQALHEMGEESLALSEEEQAHVEKAMADSIKHGSN